MNTKLRWLPIFFSATFLLLCGMSALALGQAPELRTHPTPTPVPGAPLPPEASDSIAAADLPDLVVTKIETNPATPLVGQPTEILVTIKNNSSTDLPAANNFNVDLYIDPPIDPIVNYHQIISPTLDLPWGVQSFWVPAGGSYILSTQWVFTDVQTFEIWAQVDSDGNVMEANEDNNTNNINVGVLTSQRFRDATHQDFLTNMASSLDNDDPTGLLRLSRFVEPPFVARPFTDDLCHITPASVNVTDYNMESPDARLHEVATGMQINPQLIAAGNGVLIALWEDGRHGNILDRDIYLRYSTNWGETWQPEIRVNDDPLNNGRNQLRPVAALSEDGNLLVTWQDLRNGNDYDIYAQRFGLNYAPTFSLTRSGGNIQVNTDDPEEQEDQINPDIAVDEAGGFHVVWQDNRYGNYDIFAASYIPFGGSYVWTEVRRIHDDPELTQQLNPAVNVIDWFQVTDIDYVENSDGTVTVTAVHSQAIRALAVVWEDYSKGNANIAITLSKDGGETFAFDNFINTDAAPTDPPNPNGPHQLDPDIALTKEKSLATISVQLSTGNTVDVEVEIPVTGIHTVWQDYRNGAAGTPDPDIYYSHSRLGVTQIDNIFEPELAVGGNEKVNQNDARDWQTQPVLQRDPAIAVAPCGGDNGQNAWNRFIVWADGRNYDDLNYDIYYALKSDCGASFDDNQMLNDGVRLYNFNPALYTDYSAGHPPPARQLNPGVAADIQLEGSTVSGGYLYLAWEDDRAGNPQQEKDIFFARSNLTFGNQDPYTILEAPPNERAVDGAGSQISDILDSGSAGTTWYTLAWSAATDDSTYLTVQTRLGDTITEVLASDWYPQRYPVQPQPGACNNSYDDAIASGMPIPGYDSPGQHIEDAAGNWWPQARYIQYRVNLYTRDETKTPELYDLTIYYEPNTNDAPVGPGGPGDSGDHRIYLPMILK